MPNALVCCFVAIDADLKSYDIIVPFLSEVTDMSTSDDSSAKTRGLLAQPESNWTYFALYAMVRAFEFVDLLSHSLQASDKTDGGTLKVASITVTRLQAQRNQEVSQYVVSC